MESCLIQIKASPSKANEALQNLHFPHYFVTLIPMTRPLLTQLLCWLASSVTCRYGPTSQPLYFALAVTSPWSALPQIRVCSLAPLVPLSLCSKSPSLRDCPASTPPLPWLLGFVLVHLLFLTYIIIYLFILFVVSLPSLM